MTQLLPSPAAAAMQSTAIPFDKPPRLSSPTKHHRLPSRSPTRPSSRGRDVDTLLRDLSPTATLRAFLASPPDATTTPALNTMISEYRGDPNVLARCIASLSESERALGARAAQAWLDLRTWTRELQGWTWPGRFDMQDSALNWTYTKNGTNGDVELYGSLPEQVVEEYEQRADQISQKLDEVDVEELKDYVLKSHYRPNHRASLSGSTDYRRLDDFTALVTATILQALPFLMQLTRLLDVWTVRLTVLRGAPAYLQDLRRAQLELEKSWVTIARSPSDPYVCSRGTMLQLKESLRRQIADLGRRLDRFLDDLEGRADTVPDAWIDGFEDLETNYGRWVVQAERVVLENEWRQAREERKMSARTDSRSQTPTSMMSHGDLDSIVAKSVSERAPSFSRSVSDGFRRASSISTDESGGGIAKRRAAFLNNIERTNSLKLASKSPVRPFEHASNAFTRLFKKERSPERIAPKRSNSRNITPNTIMTDDVSSTQPSSLRSTSGASFARNFSSPASSLASSASPPNASPEQDRARSSSPAMIDSKITEAQGEAKSQLHDQTHEQRAKSRPLTAKRVPETYKPTGSPSSLRRKSSDHSPPSSESINLEKPAPAGNHLGPESGENLESGPLTPNAAADTNAFDQMFVDSLPPPSAEVVCSDRATEPGKTIAFPNGRATSPAQTDDAALPDEASLTLSDSNYDEIAQAGTDEDADDGAAVTQPLFKDEILTEVEDERTIRRASAAYIGTFRRSDLKSIDVVKASSRSSGSSKSSPATAEPSPSFSSRSTPVSPVSRSSTMALHEQAESDAPPSPLDTPTAASHSSDQIRASSPVMEDEPDSPLTPANLNAAMVKRRGTKGVMQKENVAPGKVVNPISPSKKSFSGDSFDRHVSEVLEALPAPIKFRSRPGAETPVHRGYGAAEGRSALGPRAKVPGSRAPSRTGLMIAPAESSPRKPNSATEPEVKLYHLTQSGKEEPIKLFVRLVGEGERVMVRVGGGWADLADYLRQYAEHHGSRTVSEGSFEVQTVANGSNRRVSGPADGRTRTPSITTPSRSTIISDDRFSNAASASSPYQRSQTPNETTLDRSSTPVSSRPSTATGSRPSSRQGFAEVGLSGPSSGKRGLPEHKAKWVEGMIERAKASAEKSRDGDFKDLSKVGATRRVIFQPASGGDKMK